MLAFPVPILFPGTGREIRNCIPGFWEGKENRKGKSIVNVLQGRFTQERKLPVSPRCQLGGADKMHFREN